MKRLSSMFSSESDSEEFDLGKIKKAYKKPKNESNKELPSDAIKVDKKKKALISKNQMTLESAFSKSQPTKRPPANTLEQYFTKSDVRPVKVEISASDFFSGSKKRTDINANVVPEPEPAKSKQQQPSTSALSSAPAKSKRQQPSTISSSNDSVKAESFVIERSPVKDTEPIKPLTTPVKSSPAPTQVSTPQSASKKAAYHAYLNRSGPVALGSKQIPEGSPNCLAGMRFVMTGVLDSIERDAAQALIERHGGKVTSAVSGKTTHLLVGTDPGASKTEKAKKLKIKQINEDELFDLIRASQGQQPQPQPQTESSKATPKRQQSGPATTPTGGSSKKRPEKLTVIEEAKREEEVYGGPSKKAKLATDKPVATPATSTTAIAKQQSLSAKPVIAKCDKKQQLPSVNASSNAARADQPMLLSDKYRPTTMKQIVGQQGDRSCAHKLHQWLKNWHKNSSLGFNKNEEGDHFRAALLSGSPGIGKTTTAHVVCRELGFHVREYNASSARSKKHMAEVKSLAIQESNAKSWSADLRYCIVMDEIDGMAGNEDRGGIAELTNIIKTTRVPIICICNDRQSRKLQTIAKYVYDLRFRHLTLEQIKATMKSVAFKEKIAIPDAPLNDIIMASNYDLRQVFNNMQLWAATAMDSDTLSSDAKRGHKEFKIGPFDIVKRVFSHEQAHTFTEKLELFFEDYQLGGLFVQENYPFVVPHKARGDMGKTLQLMSLAADSIATSDVVSRKLRSSNNWGLLPLQGMFASVIPGEYLHGRLNARIAFPSWLGKYSKQNKNFRILSNLSLHLRSSTRGGVTNATILAMDYGQLLMRRIVRPLREGDVEATLNVLNEMQLLRDDVDLLAEATTWSHTEDPLAGVSSQIKSTLTRSYNKSSFKVPYSIIAVKKAKAVDEGSLMEGDEEGESELTVGDDQDDDETAEKDDGVDGDCMIVKKQTKSKKTAAATATSKSSSAKPKKTASAPAKPRKPAAKKSKS